MAAVPTKVPIDPAAGETQAGSSDTFQNAEEDLPANPVVTFSTLI